MLKINGFFIKKLSKEYYLTKRIIYGVREKSCRVWRIINSKTPFKIFKNCTNIEPLNDKIWILNFRGYYELRNIEDLNKQGTIFKCKLVKISNAYFYTSEPEGHQFNYKIYSSDNIKVPFLQFLNSFTRITSSDINPNYIITTDMEGQKIYETKYNTGKQNLQ